MKGLITRLINASKLNENEKQIQKKNGLTLILDGKLNESEFEVTRRKKNTYNVILFCFVRVGKTLFPVQFVWCE